MSGSDKSEESSNNVSRQEPVSPSSTVASNDQIPESTHRSKVIDQARKFLELDDIKNAERGKKAAFLKTKGLSNDDIEELLNVSEKKETLESTAKNASSQDSSDKEPQSVTTNQIPQTSQAPPIITYPEFLVNSSPKSPPLLTTSHLLTILYSTSILTATLYGTLEYIVTPMLSKLTDSRHEIFSSILLKLDILSQKLESQVSTIPVIVTPHISKESDTEAEDIDDDPTELFHRDIGIQTSPPGSPQPKNAQLAYGSLTHQTAHLCGLYTYLRDINDTLANDTQNDTRLENAIIELRKYLNTLAYPPRASNNYDSIYFPRGIMAGHNIGNGVNSDMNEVTRVKKEIKGMKGILLSARTFPGLKSAPYHK
ncbi:putative peroxisomal membrane anchor [Erysiphe neolycopersici]|uniref:Peroxisomal membrane protein PEX14 n=1 Tax=Erysiphe neolycopersici TaxID=212602 RepID=A0A420HV73_9PEZI|nr:putative peroxisomal membrane anchor [Erysiphe neolycopersici]